MADEPVTTGATPAAAAEAAPAAPAAPAATTALGDTAVTSRDSTVEGGEATVEGGEATVEGGDKDALTGAPEKYEDFKLPEGFTADKDAIEGFQAMAKELNLSQAGAQKLVDAQLAREQEAQKAVEGQWTKMRTDWLAEAKADKEIGGQKWNASLEGAKKALSQFGTPDLIKVYETFGLGNHAEVIRAWARVSEAIGEDTLHKGGAAAPAKSAKSVYTSASDA